MLKSIGTPSPSMYSLPAEARNQITQRKKRKNTDPNKTKPLHNPLLPIVHTVALQHHNHWSIQTYKQLSKLPLHRFHPPPLLPLLQKHRRRCCCCSLLRCSAALSHT